MKFNFTIYVLVDGDGYGHDRVVGAILSEDIANKHKEDGGWIEEYAENFILTKDNDEELEDRNY